MCTCCYTTSAGVRQYRVGFEPSAAHPFDDLWERKLTSVQQVKGKKPSRVALLEKPTSNDEGFEDAGYLGEFRVKRDAKFPEVAE